MKLVDTEKFIPQKLDYNFKGKKILIVEDVEDNAELLNFYFSKTQAELFFAGNGKEAVEICKSNHSIDIVLMDIQLPMMNGYEATSEIRKFMPDLPVIAITAYAQLEDKKKCFEAGCNDYLSKPISKATLFMAVDRLIK